MRGFVLRRSTLVAVVLALFCNVGIASASAISVSTTPSNYPTFSSSVSDYVIRGCPATGGVSVNVTADPGDSVSVGGQPAQAGTFTATANDTTGQEFSIIETNGTTTTGKWYMRCLPSDFPDFTASVTGTPQAQFYLTGIAKPTASDGYATFFDANGVPIWWYPTVHHVGFVNALSSGAIAWTSDNGTWFGGGNPVPVYNLSGQKLATISSPNGKIDVHELQPIGSGRVLVEVDETKCCTDLSSWGRAFPSSAEIDDQVVQEIGPNGKVLWSWDALAHINPVVETNRQWYSQIKSTGSPYDVFHMNAVSASTGMILISFRHLDAIYEINPSTGKIVMKMGGHDDPGLSYTVLNDPVFAAGGTFCGQHDARIIATNTITVHDNGTNCGRAPRAVEYSLDPTAQTATLIASVTDPRAPSSNCCGSARLLQGGDWVVDWGANPLFTELTPSGTPVYTVNWTDPSASAYRVTPILPGVFTADQLRAGMNAQYPNPAGGSATK